MSQNSKIEWTDSTWTPIRASVKPDAREIAEAKGYTSLLPIIQPGRVGPHCEHVSPGCEHCYSETNNGRCLTHNGTGLPFDRRSRDLVDIFVDEKILEQPLHWRKPRNIFVCSQTDLFGEFVSDGFIDRVFAVTSLCPRHTFQVLTKRAERMLHVMTKVIQTQKHWPIENVWLGVSVEDQKTADERIPLLLQTPAAVHWISAEPLLGPLDLRQYIGSVDYPSISGHSNLGVSIPCPRLDWVVVGGESGHGARPTNPEWVRSVRDQCVAAGVAFFFKQWGAWTANSGGAMPSANNGRQRVWSYDSGDWSELVGKKRAGAVLDGLQWREMPQNKTA